MKNGPMPEVDSHVVPAVAAPHASNLAAALRASALTPMPRLCADVPGIGGALKTHATDFEVEEVPAYQPVGTGDHLFLWLQKTDMPAFALTQYVAEALGVKAQDIGCAGLKDARAITRQYLSVPIAAETRLDALAGHAQVQLLSYGAHTNKLKTGHLKGNRFTVRIRDVHVGAYDRAQTMLGRMMEHGLPNAYGPQRFGRDGTTGVQGAQALGLLGDSRRRLGRSALRLGLSALQSTVFNAVLRHRMLNELWQTPLLGDVMAVRASGGPFVVTDPQVDAVRLLEQEIVLTGPMPGAKMRAPEQAALAMESQVLKELGLGWADFASGGKLMQGTRRPLTVWPEDVMLHAEPEGHLKVAFTLPKGAFATAVLHELMDQLPAGSAIAAAMATD